MRYLVFNGRVGPHQRQDVIFAEGIGAKAVQCRSRRQNLSCSRSSTSFPKRQILIFFQSLDTTHLAHCNGELPQALVFFLAHPWYSNLCAALSTPVASCTWHCKSFQSQIGKSAAGALELSNVDSVVYQLEWVNASTRRTVGL